MYAVKPKVEAIVDHVLAEHNVTFEFDRMHVQTWEEEQAKFLNAVEHEKVLVAFSSA